MKKKNLFTVLLIASIPSSLIAQDQNTNREKIELAPFTVKSGPVVNRAEMRAPAPALTNVSIYAVGSTKFGGYEYLSPNSLVTNGDHGGDVLRVVVWEQGYASPSSRIARLNANNVKPSYLEQPLCGTSSTVPQTCSPGQNVTGYLVYYNLDGNESGYFSYQATSMVLPNNTRNTSINIK